MTNEISIWTDKINHSKLICIKLFMRKAERIDENGYPSRTYKKMEVYHIDILTK